MIAGDILGERAHITPDKLVQVFVPTGERFTYAGLDRRAIACAQVWQQRGIGHGDRAASFPRTGPNT